MPEPTVTKSCLVENQNKDTENSLNQFKPQFDDNSIIESQNQSEYEKLVYDIIKEINELDNDNFPYQIFPPEIQEIINGANKDLGFPVEFLGASMLFAASVAIGNSHIVEVKNGFIQNAVIYLALVARPGTNKSHPLSFALDPIYRHDKMTYRQYNLEMREYDRIMELSPGERKEQSIESYKRPFWKKTILTDFTIEGLAKVHKINTRGLGVHVDELAGWIKNFYRYSKGSEMEFWLSAYSGKPINIDRKTDDPIFIDLPFISVAGTIQTGVLDELAKNGRKQNGFIDRILFVMPEGIKKQYWSEGEIETSLIETWDQIITKLHTTQLKLDDAAIPLPKRLRFNKAGKEFLLQWQKTNTDQCNDIEDEIISGIYSKMEMYVVRFALILQLLKWACDVEGRDEIGVEAVEGAIKLVEFFKIQAIRVNSVTSTFDPLIHLPENKIDLYNGLPKEFTTEEGLSVAYQCEVSESTYKRFLKDSALFLRVKQGRYKKLH